MDLMNKLEGMLGQRNDTSEGGTPAELENHFEAVSGVVPQQQLAQGISAAFNSDQTPAFGQMLGHLFNQSNPEQKAGLLNQLLGMAGPGLLSQVLGQAGLGGLTPGSQISPQQAAQVNPEAVTTLATEAHSQNPNIVNSVSEFYAQHPTLVKGLGAAALGIVLSKMAHR